LESSSVLVFLYNRPNGWNILESLETCNEMLSGVRSLYFKVTAFEGVSFIFKIEPFVNYLSPL
jgi:hypothetical protein